MKYKATKCVKLGNGHFLVEGQTADLPAGTVLPGLEPVLERVPAPNTLERTTSGLNVEFDSRVPLSERR
jgi:hypothetical protein